LLATRQAILEYLEKLEKPPAPVALDAGRVTVNFTQGYVVLVPEGKKNMDGVRLVFDAKERSHEVAAGRYRVRRYVVEDGEWAIWATGPGRVVTVAKGETTKIELDLAIQLRMQAQKHGARLQVGGAFSGDTGMGLSLVHGDARVVVRWEVGEESGDCAYG
jgi:hypothetical protein